MNYSSPGVLLGVGLSLVVSHPAIAQQGDAEVLNSIAGEAPFDWFGMSVAGIDDIDGDGAPDFLVGAPFADSNGISAAGAAYLYSGATGVLLLQWAGTEESGWLGHAVNGLGDVNGDGVADVIIGAPGESHGIFHRNGSARVYSGADGLLIQQFQGASNYQEFGRSLACLSDVDGDGVNEILIGSPRSDANGLADNGAVFLYSGQSGNQILQICGDEPLAQFGHSLSTLGDIDRDGIDDFLVGVPKASPNGQPSAGSVFVCSGATGAFIHRYDGRTEHDEFGFSLSAAGDLNTDGFEDFVIGARSAENTSGDNAAGVAFVYSGKTGKLMRTHEGEFISDNLGEAVSQVGDVNGDGIPDYAVGIPGLWNISFPWEGGTEVYSGATGQLLMEYSENYQKIRLGAVVSGLGDINFDGRADLLVAAPGSNFNISGYPGEVFVLGLSSSLDLTTGKASASSGGAVGFEIDLPVEAGYMDYQLLASFTGTGSWLHQSVEIPLVADALTYLTMRSSSPGHSQISGVLDGFGNASSTAFLPPGALNPFVGSTLWLAALASENGIAKFSSIPSKLQIQP